VVVQLTARAQQPALASVEDEEAPMEEGAGKRQEGEEEGGQEEDRAESEHEGEGQGKGGGEGQGQEGQGGEPAEAESDDSDGEEDPKARSRAAAWTRTVPSYDATPAGSDRSLAAASPEQIQRNGGDNDKVRVNASPRPTIMATRHL
jgi:hypothetical protein